MERDQIFYGRHILEEALRRGISIQSISVLNADAERWLHALWDEIAAKGSSTKKSPSRMPPVRREQQAPSTLRDHNHQGVWFACGHDFYGDFNSMTWQARERILLLSHLEDPQNMGSLVRAAVAFGFSAIIHERERSVSVSPSVVRASAGLAFAIRFYKISNLKHAIDQMKKEEFWIAALAADGASSIYDFKPAARQALVLGSEGSGISPSLQKACDDALSIPMARAVDSLNVAQAGAIAMSWLGR